jgi:hypothetical protein
MPAVHHLKPLSHELVRPNDKAQIVAPTKLDGLVARKLYDAPNSGMMSAATRTAVRKYQEPLGLSSEILSITAARSLGLIPYGVDGA